MPPLNRRIGLVAACLLAIPVVVLFAVSRESGSEVTTTTTTTTAAPTTTTTEPEPAAVAPLTGLPVADDSPALSRPALAVKIDNANSSARPQLGLSKADVIYEVRVEGGVTRFIAVFQSTDADPIGPIRSFRTSDVDVVAGLDRPLFAWHGSNLIALEELKAARSAGLLIDVGIDSASGAYERGGPHRAPHNSISTTPRLFALAPPDAGAPRALFDFAPDPATAFIGEPASAVNVAFGGGSGSAPSTWTWDDGRGLWLRDQAGTPHVDTSGEQITAANVIVQFVPYQATSQVDLTGNSVPEAVVTGEGEALVFTRGSVIIGRWSKPSPADRTEFFDGFGAPILLTPGRTFVELPPPGSATITP